MRIFDVSKMRISQGGILCGSIFPILCQSSSQGMKSYVGFFTRSDRLSSVVATDEVVATMEAHRVHGENLVLSKCVW